MRSEIEHHKNLESTLREVRDLLERQALVSRLVERQDSPRQEIVRSLVARQHEAELEKKLNKLHPADAAFVLEGLPKGQRLTAWRLIDRAVHGAILLELSAPVCASLVTLLDEPQLAALGQQMESGDFAGLIQQLPQDMVSRILSQLDSRDRTEVRSILAFPPGSVGALMQLEVVSLYADSTLEEGIATLRGRQNLPEQLTAVSVVDRKNVFLGVLTLDRLIVGAGDTNIGAVMNATPVFFFTDDRVDDAATAFERYDLISAPVVNLHREVVGWLEVDAVLDYIKQDSFKQSLSQVGLSEDEDLFAPIWSSGRKRWVWLGLNLLTAFVASRVVGAFEGSIAQMAALAALMPIVASIGGNTGNQTAALVIRGLALAQLDGRNIQFLLRKELLIGLMNGTLWGVAMGACTLLLYGSLPLAAVMAAAMLLNMLLGALVGVLCPAALNWRGRDPVMGSSILLTATTDSMGFLIFLGLATMVLL